MGRQLLTNTSRFTDQQKVSFKHEYTHSWSSKTTNVPLLGAVRYQYSSIIKRLCLKVWDEKVNLCCKTGTSAKKQICVTLKEIGKTFFSVVQIFRVFSLLTPASKQHCRLLFVFLQLLFRICSHLRHSTFLSKFSL